LATQGVYVGTSSWKYPGWCGMIYDRARYECRGKFAETRFKRDCLAEYAEVFKTVCVDAAYYTFPSQQYLEGMVMQTPDDFLFGLKVTDTITINLTSPRLTHKWLICRYCSSVHLLHAVSAQAGGCENNGNSSSLLSTSLRSFGTSVTTVLSVLPSTLRQPRRML